MRFGLFLYLLLKKISVEAFKRDVFALNRVIKRINPIAELQTIPAPWGCLAWFSVRLDGNLVDYPLTLGTVVSCGTQGQGKSKSREERGSRFS